MRRSMRASVVTGVNHDWSDFAQRGQTEPAMPAVRVPVEVVDDSPNQDDIDTLREIECALEAVESRRPSARDIETCISSNRRTPFSSLYRDVR